MHKKSIAVIGGGISGISAAMELAKTGHYAVTLFEKDERLGGLSTWFQWEKLAWDKYYHVILSTDAETLSFIDELGLQEKLFWRETKSGFYGEGKLVSMSTALDFLRFPFMSMWQKIRMGLGIFYSSRLKNTSKLDRIYAKQWLISIFGRRVYEKIWEPLLRSKLGEAKEKTSALLIWASIKRLYGSRQGKEKKEMMGHVQGGYRTIMEAASEKMTALGINVKVNEPVTTVQTNSQPFTIDTPIDSYSFDKILFTVDNPTILNLLNNPSGEYWQRLRQTEYLSVYCVVLLLSKKLSPYYVINLLDQDLPFTGIIEFTNIVSPAEIDNNHIVFLPKYAPKNDPIHTKTDKEITNSFISNLKKVFPELEDAHILHHRMHKTDFVQPIQSLEYQKNIPPFTSPISGVFVVNTSMILNSTLNNNITISLARQCVETIRKGESSVP